MRAATQRLFEQLGRIAATNSTVLIEGEAGTASDVAQEIVQHGVRAGRRWWSSTATTRRRRSSRRCSADDRGVSDLRRARAARWRWRRAARWCCAKWRRCR